jgi:Dihydrodipicolinate synthetase family
MNSEQPAALLQGVYVANVTPFSDDDRYSIDHRSYGAHVRWLADHGVTGIVPFGTKWRGSVDRCREKRPVFEVLAEAAADLQIIATVAEANLPDTLDQLAFLDDLPVRAVMVMPPYYFKPVETEGLKIFFERVVAVTRHPVVLYHIPKYAIPIPANLVVSLPVWGSRTPAAKRTMPTRSTPMARGCSSAPRTTCPADCRRLTVASQPWRTSSRSRSWRFTPAYEPAAGKKPRSCPITCAKSAQ